MLMLSIEDMEIIQINTDGAGIYLKINDLDKAYEVCKQWEKDWSLKLEYVEYGMMIMRDVNNFIAIPAYTEKDGIKIPFDNDTLDVNNKDDVTKKVKLKGFFEIEKDWHKNHSMKIVQKALANYFIKGIPVEKTIRESKDIFDFFKVCKAKSNFKIEYWEYNKQGDKSITSMHKITRYLVSNNGGQLMKVMPPIKTLVDTETEKFRKTHPNQTNMFDFVDDVLVIPERESNVEAGHNTTIHNKLTSLDINDYDINYDYYINECKKVLKAIEGNESFEITDDDQLDMFDDDLLYN